MNAINLDWPQLIFKWDDKWDIGYRNLSKKKKRKEKHPRIWFCLRRTEMRRQCCWHSLVGCKWIWRDPLAWYTNILEQSVVGNSYDSLATLSTITYRSMPMPAFLGKCFGVANIFRSVRAGVMRFMCHILWLFSMLVASLDLFRKWPNKWSRFRMSALLERTLYALWRKIWRFSI